MNYQKLAGSLLRAIRDLDFEYGQESEAMRAEYHAAIDIFPSPSRRRAADRKAIERLTAQHLEWHQAIAKGYRARKWRVSRLLARVLGRTYGDRLKPWFGIQPTEDESKVAFWVTIGQDVC